MAWHGICHPVRKPVPRWSSAFEQRIHVQCAVLKINATSLLA